MDMKGGFTNVETKEKVGESRRNVRLDRGREEQGLFERKVAHELELYDNVLVFLHIVFQ